MARRKTIERSDLVDLAAYAAERKARRAAVVELKKRRRVAVGPFATFFFESFDTMLMQVQEMLYIEKGGEAQIADELAAYNPMIPNGGELTATLMLEIEDPDQRARALATLGRIEDTVALEFAGESVRARPESDQERTDESGKTSAVHFLHFPFTPAQAAKFKAAGTRVVLGFGHANYGHMAMLPETVRAELAEDLD
ncbi:MAG: DUF3501 family protein [Alphaproteobacteria bacterium]|nr:DUF3501 family protein [Alphaproteobacteria bacterium]